MGDTDMNSSQPLFFCVMIESIGESGMATTITVSSQAQLNAAIEQADQASSGSRANAKLVH